MGPTHNSLFFLPLSPSPRSAPPHVRCFLCSLAPREPPFSASQCVGQAPAEPSSPPPRTPPPSTPPQDRAPASSLLLHAAATGRAAGVAPAAPTRPTDRSSTPTRRILGCGGEMRACVRERGGRAGGSCAGASRGACAASEQDERARATGEQEECAAMASKGAHRQGPKDHGTMAPKWPIWTEGGRKKK